MFSSHGGLVSSWRNTQIKHDSDAKKSAHDFQRLTEQIALRTDGLADGQAEAITISPLRFFLKKKILGDEYLNILGGSLKQI